MSGALAKYAALVTLVAGSLSGSIWLAYSGAAVAAPQAVYNRPSAMYPAGDEARGRQLAEPCLACHGTPDMVIGDPAIHPPKLRYQRASSVFYALQDYRDGQRRSDAMGAVAKTLSDQDMRDLAAYLTAGPNRHVGASPGGPQLANSWAHAKVDEVCGFCHGESGLGELEGYPALAGQSPDYIEHALVAYRTGTRANPIMRGFAKHLTPEEINRLAVYFAAQPGLERNQ